VPPDKEGLIHETDIKSLMGFKELLNREFENELAKGKRVTASDSRGRSFRPAFVNDGNSETYWATPDDIHSGDLIIDLGSETEVNRILIQEYIRLGQRVEKFTVSALVNGEWNQLVEGTTIGYKIIRKFPVIKTSEIKINIDQAKACPTISNIELFRAPGD
jgi:alpha-L-fucosidase